MLTHSLQLLESRRHLSMNEMADAMGSIIEGRCREDDIARFLALLHEKGETVEEIAGAATALRQRMTPIRSNISGLLDTCGTGGDGSATFNISTAAAIVAAASGVPVAKHGNRSVTSRSGSADALAELGVNVEADVPQVEACLEKFRICFCFAPLLHQAMRHVAPIRKKLGIPTIFNLLGPLTNPAGAPFQLLGVGKAELQPLLAQALVLLGTRRAVVVHGADGLDEVTLAGPTNVIEAINGKLNCFEWTPEDFGLKRADMDGLKIASPAESAAAIRALLDGRQGPARDIVLANAAAAIWTAGLDDSLKNCAKRAAAAIDSGKAKELLKQLADFTNVKK